jgi:3-hydroxy-9,10-secoandrosta-1,3,5(10)-triene-9,17-dione monooxygenase reductase component
MEIKGEILRDAMCHWASGVAVITSICGSARAGTTISSFTSLSLEPSLILVNLASENPTQTMIQQSGFFGITLLGKKQKEISDLFASYNKEIKDRFNGLKIFTLTSGVPFIEGGLAYLDCKVYHRCEMPKSVVIVGVVMNGRLGEAGYPLVYLNRGYVGIHS